MYIALEVLTVVLAAIAMALSLAHALELPGKMRLDKEQYFTVQRIYYPGFTIGGISEPAVIVAILILLVMTPRGTPAFWLAAGALLAFLVMQLIFWIMTQPINKVWLEQTKLTASAARFFGTEREAGIAHLLLPDWTVFATVGSAPTFYGRWPQCWDLSC